MISGKGEEDIRPLPNLAKVQIKVKIWVLWRLLEHMWAGDRKAWGLCYRFQILSDDIHGLGVGRNG